MRGIYAYYDTVKDEIVYVGKDSHIERDLRHKQHHQSSNYNEQIINRVLQDNKGRYDYKPIYVCSPHLDEVDLNGLEMQYIEALNPKFNFSNGGDGFQSGNKHPYYGKSLSIEHRKKISETLKGRVFSEEHRRKLSERGKGRKVSEETRRKISENHADFSGENHPMYGIKGENHPHFGKKRSLECKINISKSRNKSGFFRVHKMKSKTYKQGFTWVYRWTEDRKVHRIFSIDLDKLEERVKAKGLEWYKLDEVLE